MTTKLALNPSTERQLSRYIAMPTHALLLVAPQGSGKGSLSSHLAATLLEVDIRKMQNHPYIRLLTSADGKAIGIEAIRELEHFLRLKVPGEQAIDRVVVIEDGHLLTHEAQNALLKTLEDPPQATAIILTTSHQAALLPTIRSRVQTVHVLRPPAEQLQTYFTNLGFTKSATAQAYAISGGLPGLMQALLEETDHPLRQAVDIARQLLLDTSYDRLLKVDELTRQRSLITDVCYILQQMAHISLQNANDSLAARRWQGILTASYQASAQLAVNAQPKLILTNLMLNLS